jgi:hypothetical protein
VNQNFVQGGGVKWIGEGSEMDFFFLLIFVMVEVADRNILLAFDRKLTLPTA